jgi:hypothetical protein
MRKRFLIVPVGLIVAAAVAGTAISAPAVQTIDSTLGGKTTPKFDKKKFKATSVEVTTTTSDQANPAGIPPKATKAVIVFDKKDVKFNPKAVPGCDPNSIENTTTDAARAACPNSIVGGGSAVASLPLGAGGTRRDFPAVVTAFNRGDANGILLHSRVDALGTTVVLKGVLSGSTLSVDIPPLGGGVGAIASFQTKVQKKDYVQGRCKDKKIDTSATFTFSDAPAATATDSQKCKQKKSS